MHTNQNTASKSGNWVRWAWWVGIPVLLLAVWEGLYTIIGQPALASVPQTLNFFFDNAGYWAMNIGLSLFALLISCLICGILGVMGGFAIGLSSFWTRVFEPLFSILYSIPKVVLYPIFLLIFGVSFSGKVGFSAFHGIFPILIISMSATQSVPSVYRKVAQVHRLTFFQTATRILFPSILPQLVVGLRTGFTTALAGLILGEMFASYSGIGYLLMNYSSQLQVDALLGVFCCVLILAILITIALLSWEHHTTKKYTSMEQKTEKMQEGLTDSVA